MPTGGKQFGYIISILINFGMLYATNNVLQWNVPFLTDNFSQVLWVINLSLGANIFTYFTFIFFDRRWFKNLMQALTNIFSFFSLYFFRVDFPLDISESLAGVVNFAIVVVLVLLVLSALTELTNAVHNYRKMVEKAL